MDVDRPLKELLRLRPRDLLALFGDAGADFVSTQVAELPSLSRRVDTVLKLRHGRQSYIRHLEFEVRYRKGLELRCFEYATRLVVHYRTPVLTTVVFLEKPGRKELAYREVLDGRVVHERRFDVLRLWEVNPERALRLGPGAAALVGLAEKGTLPLLVRAARKIHRETEGVARSDLLFILQALGRRRYTESDLAGVIPRETIMASSLWAEAMREGRNEGRKEGRKEGALAESRSFCIELTREHHPELADRLVPLIEACPEIERLHEWGLQATRLPDTEFLRLVTEQATSASRQVGQSRTPRPSRRAKARSSK